MPILVNKLDRAELRRQRRYAAPVFEVIVECDLFRSLDISLGGARLDRLCEELPIGTVIEGWIALPGVSQAFAFSGEILRTDAATGNTVVRFDEVEPDTAAFIEEAAVRRLH
jgi:hypothetical protein